MNKRIFIIMAILLNTLLCSTVKCQWFKYPSGSIDYVYDLNNKSINDYSSQRNKWILKLDPEILGINFNVTSCYSVIQESSYKIKGFTFNVRFDEAKFKNRKLNKAELQNHYNTKLSTNDS